MALHIQETLLIVYASLSLAVVGHTEVFQNVSLVTLGGVEFREDIYDIKSHVDTGLLLILDSHALWWLDPTAGLKSLIAGQDRGGYQEGVGDHAKFDWPTSMVVACHTKVYISDYFNSCIRQVDLQANQTSPYAGVCQEQGRLNGALLVAHFHKPRGLLQLAQGILVADEMNHAVRLIRNGKVQNFVDADPIIWKPRYMLEMGAFIYLTTNSGLVRLDPKERKASLVTGTAKTPGFSDGPLDSALFNQPSVMIKFSPAQILLTDTQNNRLRLVDFNSGWVRSVCTGVSGHIDGTSETCQLQEPWSLVMDDKMYIGQNEIIRISSVKSSTNPTKSVQDCPPDSKPTKHVVGLQASYNVNCGSSGEGMMQKQLLPDISDLRKLCPKCQLRKDLHSHPVVECRTSGIVELKVTWITSIELPTNASLIPPTVRGDLVKAILEAQRNWRTNSRFLELLLITSNPPTISPMVDGEGLYLRPVAVSACPGDRFFYPVTDSCPVLTW